jgi:hypothetical protein
MEQELEALDFALVELPVECLLLRWPELELAATQFSVQLALCLWNRKSGFFSAPLSAATGADVGPLGG